jgi:hypothetical protein
MKPAKRRFDSSGGNDWFDNTSYMNGTQYDMLASDPTLLIGSRTTQI